MVQAALAVDARGQLNSDGFSNLTGLTDYGSMLEEDAVIKPGGNIGRLPKEANAEAT